MVEEPGDFGFTEWPKDKAYQARVINQHDINLLWPMYDYDICVFDQPEVVPSMFTQVIINVFKGRD